VSLPPRLEVNFRKGPGLRASARRETRADEQRGRAVFPLADDAVSRL